MKKSIAMLLSLAMAASLTACGGGSKPAETPAPESTTTAAAADTSEEAKTEAAADGAEDPFAALGDFNSPLTIRLEERSRKEIPDMSPWRNLQPMLQKRPTAM